MPNQYPAPCSRCGKTVKPGDGHYERIKGKKGWSVRHTLTAGGCPDKPPRHPKN